MSPSKSGRTAVAAGLGLQESCPAATTRIAPATPRRRARRFPGRPGGPEADVSPTGPRRLPAFATAAPQPSQQHCASCPAAAGRTPPSLSAPGSSCPRPGPVLRRCRPRHVSSFGSCTLPAVRDHVHPPQPEGAKARGRRRGMPSRSWTCWRWQRGRGRRGGPLSAPSDVPAAVQKKSLPLKSDEREAQSYFPAPGQQTALLPGLTGKDPSVVTANYFPLSAAKIPYFFGRQSDNTLSAARC